MILRKPILFLFAILLFSSCWMRDDLVEQTYEEGISVDRYDRLQSEYILFNSFNAQQKMNTTYSRATQILVEEILGIGEVSEDNINEKIRAYYSDTTLLRLIDDVEDKFTDLARLEKDLTKGFKKLRKELPKVVVPRVYTQISAFNESIVVVDSLLGISLDKYMGENYPLYSRFYYDYQRRSMRPERIPSDCFVFYLLSQYPLPQTSGRTLLEQIIHHGQISYVTQQLLDYPSVTDVAGYSDAEKKWWGENRKRVWNYMHDNNMLQATDPMLIRNFLYPTFSPPFGTGSPMSIGICMGGEIVAAYMKLNKKVSLEELLATTDYYKLLDEAKFKP